MQLTLKLIIGVASATAISILGAIISGESILDAFVHGLADGIFWSGLFALITAGVNAIKTGVNNYASRQKELVEEYIKKYAKTQKMRNKYTIHLKAKLK